MTTTPPRIIAIDDDARVLRSLQRELRGMPFELTTETDPVAALARMQREEFDVVISDCRMPGMDGVQFLAEVSHRHPLTVLIMLSGHADMQDILESVSAAGIFRFISKPWSLPELREALAEALAQRVRLQAAALSTHAVQATPPLQ
jgi:DNA-binding NtrC family response regulator